MIPRLTDLTQERERQNRATARVAWALARDSWLSADARQTMTARGFGHHVKSGDTLLSDDSGVNLLTLNAAFVGQVDAQSIVGRLDGRITIPLAAAARLQLGEIVATGVVEGDEKQVARMAFDVAGPPSKVVAQIVVSNEAMRCFDAPTQSAISGVLVSAVAAAQDAALVSALTAGTSTGSATPAALFAACSGGRPARPYLIGGLDAVLSLTAGTLQDLAAVGVQVLTTPAATGFLIGLDAAGLLVSEGELTIESARHASMVLDYGGGSPAPTVSLWQANLSAIRCERFIRFGVRSGAVAFASVGSPA